MTSSPQTRALRINMVELLRHPGSERTSNTKSRQKISAASWRPDNLKLQEMSLLRSPPLPPPMMLQSQVLLRFRGVVSVGDV